MDGSKLTQEDKDRAVSFGNFIHANARWNLDTASAMELNRHLVWYSAMIRKLEANILEVVKVTEPVKKAK